MSNEELAMRLYEAIKSMVEKEGCLENFTSYLTHSFDSWYDKFASTPEGLVNEFEMFSNIDCS